MSKLKDWIEAKLFWLKTGIPIKVANDGKPIEQVVIFLRGYYLFVDMDEDSGEPTGDFSWSTDPTMSPTPVREHYTAIRERHHG